jgi:signal transduction histidine kinase
VSSRLTGLYAQNMDRPGTLWVQQLVRSPRLANALFFAVAVTFGVLIMSQAVHSSTDPLTGRPFAIDVVCGSLACLALWWRRRWPVGVALVAVLLGTFSSSATIAGLLALGSLAVHRSIRPVLLVGALWIPTSILYALYSQRTDALTVTAVAGSLALAAMTWGMFIRARRQLLLTLRERAVRAEADQRLHADRARMAERTRIAREMHDVLAHRISLVALHAGALEVRPDLPPEEVRETAELLRSTARQALEELRAVIGVLREEPGQLPAPAAPQPTLADIPRLVEETRRAGTKIDFDMRVDHPDAAPSSLGRDAYRIVQEALTNIGKHARGTAGRVRVTGAADHGLHVSISNPLPVHAQEPSLPGSGAGLLGLQERVTLAGGALVHGPDGSGNFVVDAELRW